MPDCKGVISHGVVEPGWIDFNGHMNFAYYVVVFDRATDALWAELDVGVDYLRRTGRTMYVVETHLTYDREVKAGEPLTVHSLLAGADDKRLHVFLRMRHGTTGDLVATSELLCLHVDQSGASARAVSFAPEQQARFEAVGAAHAPALRTATLGRAIALKGRRASAPAP